MNFIHYEISQEWGKLHLLVSQPILGGLPIDKWKFGSTFSICLDKIYISQCIFEPLDTLCLISMKNFFLKFILAISVFLVTSFSCKAIDLNLYVAEAGDLINMVDFDSLDYIDSLTISGDLNGTDILVIRKMINLSFLDMRDANIVNGNQPYYDHYITTENTIGSNFIYSTNDIEIFFPNSVLEIEEGCLNGCTGKIFLTLGENTIKIGSGAFSGLNIVNIKLSENLLEIGDASFSRCPILETIQLPNNLNSIGKYAFSECISLNNIEIPSKVLILDSCFEGCSSLTKVKLNEGLEIMNNTFKDCIALESIELPKTLQELWGTFHNCYSLNSIILPENITYIDRLTFAYCTNLSTITIPSKINILSYKLFEGCRNLREVNILGEISEIEGGCFMYCESLTTFPLQNTVKSIRSGAFHGTSLEEVIIPTSVEELWDAFTDIKELDTFTITKSNNPLKIINDIFEYSNINNLYIGRNLIGDYYRFDNSNIKNLTLFENIDEFYFRLKNKIETIHSYNPVPPLIFNNTFTDETYIESILYVPKGFKNYYIIDPMWGKFQNIEEEEYIPDNSASIINSITNCIDNEKFNVYTKEGQKIPVKKKEDILNLTQGIYIINGKKYLIK